LGDAEGETDGAPEEGSAFFSGEVYPEENLDQTAQINEEAYFVNPPSSPPKDSFASKSPFKRRSTPRSTLKVKRRETLAMG